MLRALLQMRQKSRLAVSIHMDTVIERKMENEMIKLLGHSIGCLQHDLIEFQLFSGADLQGFVGPSEALVHTNHLYAQRTIGTWRHHPTKVETLTQE